MALSSSPESSPESRVNGLSVALTEHYFHMIFQKYDVSFPEDVSWKEVDEFPSLNGHEQIYQKTLNVVFELADLFEDARVEEMVKKCETLNLNSDNLYSHFTETINVLLDDGITWGKVVMFFSFAVSFAVYLCTTGNEMSHMAGQVSVWTAQDLQNRIQPWVDDNGGWESLSRCGKETILYNNNQKEAMKKFGQTSLMLGVFVVAAFTVKQLFK